MATAGARAVPRPLPSLSRLLLGHQGTATMMRSINHSGCFVSLLASLPERHQHHQQLRLYSHATTTSSASAHSNVVRDPSRLSFLQRGLLAVGSSLVAFADPERADMVAALGETTGDIALRNMHARMKRDEVGRQILLEKPRITEKTLDLDALAKLDKNTFGYSYQAWMRERGFSPDSRVETRFIQDPELAYVMQRYREVHDLWHVLAGLPTTVSAEIALKWLELIQTGLPVCALSGMVGPLRLSCEEKRDLLVHYVPWAIRCGRSTKDLLCVYYEHHWDKPLEDVRAMLRFVPAPTLSH
eukprot:TRINITY_DN16557_c0_g1_i1.p1 TRINITY_DN16557_c0_g1~~TRINITY_DN16557_c0_g1_i1.p1  ORF type:complete len:300 (-),score=37.79 TRINITY_DN16557_c0_g1_i1:16-915(-)